MPENYCQKHGCSECCIAMVHRRIPVEDASHLAGDKPRVNFSSRDQFEQSTHGEIMSTFGNSQHDLINKYRKEGSVKNMKMDLFQPRKCRLLGQDGLCVDYENRAISCRNLVPGGKECLKIRQERNKD